MARSIWSGAIRFGLVNIPVRLSPAIRPDDVAFHLLHAKDDGRIRFKRVCAADGAEVRPEEIVKAYEVSRGRLVRVSPEELDSLHPKTVRAIDLDAFVPLADVDPAFFDGSYFVAPDEGAGRAYALLEGAMRQAGRVAVGRMVMRTRPTTCLLRTTADGLVLATLRYAASMAVRERTDLPTAADAQPSPRELEMAGQHVASLSGPWDPGRYVDDFRQRLLALVRRKAEGQEVVAAREEGPAKVLDLAEALAASLAAAASREGRRTAPPVRKAAARTRRRPC